MGGKFELLSRRVAGMIKEIKAIPYEKGIYIITWQKDRGWR